MEQKRRVKTFPTLYSRASNGKIHTWQIIVDGASYQMITGQVDGKTTSSKPTIVKGKNISRANETSPEEQALLEAQSKFDKKSKTGYFTEISEVDNLRYVDPMLAKKFFERKDRVVYPQALQCKFNGSRCVITRHGAFSRKGEEFLTVPHITESLKPFFEKWPDAKLDGELFNNDLREQLNEIMKLIRRTVNITEEHLAASRDKIKFYIYDGFDFNEMGPDEPYEDRKAFIDQNVVRVHSFTEEVRDFVVNNEEELMDVYNMFLEDHQEGAITRNPSMSYKIGGRSSDLLKMKPEDSAEGVIDSIHEGDGNWGGVAKTCTIVWNDLVFDATFKCDRERAKEILDNPEEFLGKRVTFLYNGLTGLKTPQYARVDPNNCFKS